MGGGGARDQADSVRSDMAGLGLLSLLSVISLPPSALPLELTDLTGAFMSSEMKGN